MGPRVSPEEQPAAICVGFEELAACCAPNSRNGTFMEWPLMEQADKPSIRLAGGCDGSHDLVDAGFKFGGRERFLKKWKWGRVLTRRLIIIDAFRRNCGHSFREGSR